MNAENSTKHDVPHISLGDLGFFHVRGCDDDLDQQDLAVRLQSWNDLTQDPRAVLHRPVMTDVTQHIHIRVGGGLRLEEVVWHKLHPSGKLGRQSRGTLFDRVLVVLND